MGQGRTDQPVCLWWVRRDLRLHDNPALAAAQQVGTVVPVFVLDPALQGKAPRRTEFLLGSLRALDGELRARGSSLVVRRGPPADVLARLVVETGARRVFAHADVSPFARRRESEVARRVPLQLVGWPTAYSPLEARTSQGRPFSVFAAFRRWARSRPWPEPALPPPTRLHPHGVPSEPLPDAGAVPTGEEVAIQRARRFAEGPIYEYHNHRDRLDLVGSSRLSAYLRFGVLSPRRAMELACSALEAASTPGQRAGPSRWLDELLWREFFAHLLFHHPHTRREPLRSGAREPVWEDDDRLYRAWCEGLTGYPVVDAAMRELVVTGWISNRARMVAASFLVKNLLLDWRLGERFFLHHLVDGDPASNGGNWQWVAGVGTDAAPYFRVFNPVLQGQRFDPDGTYVRRWLPELARVPTPYVHAPWTLPRDDQIAYRCRVGRDYPAPVVDLAESRRRALERYRAAARPAKLEP